MRRLIAAVAVAALAAAAFAAWTVAAPGNTTKAQGPRTSLARPKLPPLPGQVRRRGRWLIGVKCDFPPFGYINVRGQNAGYDVEVARRFAQLAFRSSKRVKFTCVTTPSRIPTLTQKRVDIIISTLTWTASREEVIDYSMPYYSATGRLLVPNRSTLTLRNLNGKSVTTTRGSIYDRWVRNCFKSSSLIVTDSPVTAVENLKQGRAETFMFDDAYLLGVATQDATLRLTNDKFLNIPWGIGIRKGEPAMKKWVNAALLYMKKRDEFITILKHNSPTRLFKSFKGNVPRPNNRFRYPRGTVPEEKCP
jgi:polar amino acid transport system substrate-binding protein